MGLFDTYCVLGIALFLPKNKDWGVPGSAQDQKGVDSCNLYKSCAVTGHVQHTVLAEDNNTSAAPLCPQTPPRRTQLVLCPLCSRLFQDGTWWEGNEIEEELSGPTG